jgi:hypothetical protein
MAIKVPDFILGAVAEVVLQYLLTPTMPALQATLSAWLISNWLLLVLLLLLWWLFKQKAGSP